MIVDQMKIIYILWLRQLKRYVRARARILTSFAQPLLFFVALSFGFGPIFARAGGGDYLQFLSPGVIMMSVLFTAMFSGIDVVWEKQFGFLKETLVAPVPRVTIMLGRTLGGATVAFLNGGIVFLITLLFGFRPELSPTLLLAPVIMILVAVLFTALGTALASRLNDMYAFPLVANFVNMPLFFLSGALFPVEDLPKALSMVIRVNPLTYGVDGVRGALIGNVHFGFGTDIAVLVVALVLAVILGAVLFRKIEA